MSSASILTPATRRAQLPQNRVQTALPSSGVLGVSGRALLLGLLAQMSVGLVLASEVPYRVGESMTEEVGVAGCCSASHGELPDGRVVFQGYDDDHGFELWISDGSPSGTLLLSDLNPGPGSGVPGRFFEFDGRVFFHAFTLAHGLELWQTDGTVQGTSIYVENMPGQSSSLRFDWSWAIVDQELFWVAESLAEGVELRITDGDGTFTTLDQVFGPDSSWPEELLPLPDGRLFFSRFDPVLGREPFVTDGTVLGTEAIADLWSGSPGSSPSFPVVLPDGRVLFAARSPAFGEELVLWDESNLSTPIEWLDLRAGSSGSDPESLYLLGSALYFCANSSSGEEPHAWDLGSSLPVQLADLKPGPGSSCSQTVFRQAASGVVFNASIGSEGQDLFVTQGTVATTTVLFDVPASNSGTRISFDTTAAQPVFFAATNGSAFDLHSTDGATVQEVEELGASLVSLESSPSGDLWLQIRRFSDPGGLLVVPSGGGSASELATFGSTSASFAELRPGRTPGELIWRGTTELGSEPWTVRTGSSPELIGDLAIGAASSSPQFFAIVGSRVVFRVADGAGPVVWDGASVQQVTIDPTPGFVTLSNGHTTFGQLVLFNSRTSDASFEQSVVALDPTSGAWEALSATPSRGTTLYPAGQAALFLGGASQQASLWMTEGTAASSQELGAVPSQSGRWGAVLRPETGSGDLNFVLAGEDAEDGVELFALRGGTLQQVEDIHPDGDSTPRSFLAGPTGRAVFVADVDSSGSPQLFVVADDGSVGQLTSFGSDAEGLTPLVALDHGWLFSARTDAHGLEAWFTDGTEIGTRVLDIVPGPDSSAPGTSALPSFSGMSTDGSHAYWFAWTSGSGYELWRSDGTVAGTQMLPEIIPGPAGQARQRPSVWSGGLLYFAANGADGAGEELWAYSPEGVIFLDGFEVDGAEAWAVAVP